MAVLYFNRLRGTNQAQNNDGRVRVVNLVTRHLVMSQTETPRRGKPTVIRLRTATIRVWENSSGELVIEVDPP